MKNDSRPDVERIIRGLLDLKPELNGAPSEMLDQFARDLSKVALDRFGNPQLPDSRETVGVSFWLPKTTALFFDRVWSMPVITDHPPQEIMVYGATDLEIVTTLSGLVSPEETENSELNERVTEHLRKFIKTQPTSDPSRNISAALFAFHGLQSTPIYSSAAGREAEYQPGRTDLILSAVADAPVVDEKKLEWEQVINFRHDVEARAKYRRMIHWLDSEMVGRSSTFISDRIAIKLEDYEWALRKHGIEWKRGVLEGLLDPKFLPAASATVAALSFVGDQLWAAIGGLSLLIGKTVFTVTRTAVDLEDIKRGTNSEIAFVHEIKSQLNRK